MKRQTHTADTRVSGTGRVATMRDIAAAAGVSQSTVSRVLNHASSAVPIAPETRERVLAVSGRLGYQPNPLARGLRGARTMLLGVIVREITDPFFASAIEVISAEARTRGYNVVLGHVHGRADEAIVLRRVLETRHVDAIVVLGDVSEQPLLVEDLRETHVPVVSLWQGPALPGIASVIVDNRAGVTAALDHLWELGHREVGFIAGRALGDIRERRTAFGDFFASRDRQVPGEYVEHTANDALAAADAITRLLRLPSPPTAVLASTDVLAIGALHGAFRLRVHVPQAISVVGFDDIPMAAYTVPALTTVHMPMAEMAAEAIRFVIDEGGGARGAAEMARVLRPWLVLRGSSGPPPSDRNSSSAGGSRGRRRAKEMRN